MNGRSMLLAGLFILILAIVLSGCSPRSPSTAAASGTFTDPFAYCAAVGTVDAPNSRYTGTAVPDQIINGFKKSAGLESSTEPMAMLRKTTIWRCMGGKVYACNFGANLPCDSKADTAKTPSQAMSDFCKANPSSAIIPMSVTGHSTIYSWHCVNDSAEMVEQVETVDAAGYIGRIWYPIQPGP